MENRKGRGAQCAQNLSSGTFYFGAPSWRWWREISKVITVMEMCMFCDDSWARGRCDHMMHRDWVSGRTWTVTTGQSWRVFFAVSETCLGKNKNKIKVVNNVQNSEIDDASLYCGVMYEFSRVLSPAVSSDKTEKTMFLCRLNPSCPFSCSAVDPSWHFSAGAQEASCHWQTATLQLQTEPKQGCFLPTLHPRVYRRSFSTSPPSNVTGCFAACSSVVFSSQD